MIRLTLLLIAAIGVTMVVAGRKTDGADGRGDALFTEVARSEDVPSDLVPSERRLDIDDIDGAVAMALAATRDGAQDENAPEAAAAGERAPEGGAPDPAGGGGPDDPAPWFVTGSRVNLRAGPSTTEAVVGQAGLGQEARVIERTEDGWVRIRVPDLDRDAYIFGRFLSAERPS